MITPHANKDVEKLNHSYIAGKNAKWHSHSGALENSLKIKQFEIKQFENKKLNIQRQYNLAVALSSIYSREMKIYFHTKICTECSTLFVITKTWEEPRYPSLSEWLNECVTYVTI